MADLRLRPPVAVEAVPVSVAADSGDPSDPFSTAFVPVRILCHNPQ